MNTSLRLNNENEEGPEEML